MSVMRFDDSKKKGRPPVGNLPFSIKKIKIYLTVVKLQVLDQAPFTACTRQKYLVLRTRLVVMTSDVPVGTSLVTVVDVVKPEVVEY